MLWLHSVVPGVHRVLRAAHVDRLEATMPTDDHLSLLALRYCSGPDSSQLVSAIGEMAMLDGDGIRQASGHAYPYAIP